jgi:hypothetical protein
MSVTRQIFMKFNIFLQEDTKQIILWKSAQWQLLRDVNIFLLDNLYIIYRFR